MKLMNFGSLNLDRKYGVGNFVAPGETKSADSYFENLGGKGLNQSIACARAGSAVWHVCRKRRYGALTLFTGGGC